MIYLILSIISSSAIFLIFKQFKKYEINSIQAIVVNYLVCIILGISLTKNNSELFTLVNNVPVFIFSLFLGGIFIFCFSLISSSSQRVGAAVTSIAAKTSLIIPVLFAYFHLNESLSLYRWGGIFLAITSIFLLTPERRLKTMKNRWVYFLPFLVFFTGGILDTTVKVLQTFYLNNDQFAPFLSLVFSVAFIIGIIITLTNYIIKKEFFSLKTIVAGLILGFPNYCSVYFLLKALDLPGIESTFIFPVNNIGIIVLSSLSAWIFLREKIEKKYFIGFSLAILSIIFIIK